MVLEESEPLIDMMCRVDDGFHAIQSTVRTSHHSDADKIKKLQEELQLVPGTKLKIFYASQSTRYKQFVTDPVNPLLEQPDPRMKKKHLLRNASSSIS